MSTVEFTEEKTYQIAVTTHRTAEGDMWLSCDPVQADLILILAKTIKSERQRRKLRS